MTDEFEDATPLDAAEDALLGNLFAELERDADRRLALREQLSHEAYLACFDDNHDIIDSVVPFRRSVEREHATADREGVPHARPRSKSWAWKRAGVWLANASGVALFFMLCGVAAAAVGTVYLLQEVTQEEREPAPERERELEPESTPEPEPSKPDTRRHTGNRPRTAPVEPQPQELEPALEVVSIDDGAATDAELPTDDEDVSARVPKPKERQLEPPATEQVQPTPASSSIDEIFAQGWGGRWDAEWKRKLETVQESDEASDPQMRMLVDEIRDAIATEQRTCAQEKVPYVILLKVANKRKHLYSDWNRIKAEVRSHMSEGCVD